MVMGVAVEADPLRAVRPRAAPAASIHRLGVGGKAALHSRFDIARRDAMTGPGTQIIDQTAGWVAERFKAPVLKTGRGASPS